MRRCGLSWAGFLSMALLLGPSGSQGGALDPRPEGNVLCLLDEAFIPRAESRFVTGLTTGGFILGYRRAGTPRTVASIFDVEGGAVGPEIVLDEPFVGQQSALDVVTSAPDGDWLATWTGDGSPGTDEDLTSVKARLFDASGSPLGDSFQVNTFEHEVQSTSDAVFLAGGGFVVVFESDAFEIFVHDIRARLFSANGQPLGNDFIVTEDVEGSAPEVVALFDGGFVVLFKARSHEGEPLGLGVHHYDAAGVLESQALVQVYESPDEIIRNLIAETDPTDDSLHVALVIAQFEGELDRAITRLVNLKRIGNSFVKTATFDVVSEDPGSVNWDPSLLVSPTSLPTLVWNSNPTGLGYDYDVLAWTFSTANEPLSEVVQIDGDLEQSHAGAALVAPGRGIAAWRATEGSCDMQGRFFGLPQPLFMDGFESGTTDSWSVTVE